MITTENILTFKKFQLSRKVIYIDSSLDTNVVKKKKKWSVTVFLLRGVHNCAFQIAGHHDPLIGEEINSMGGDSNFSKRKTE